MKSSLAQNISNSRYLYLTVTSVVTSLGLTQIKFHEFYFKLNNLLLDINLV